MGLWEKGGVKSRRPGMTAMVRVALALAIACACALAPAESFALFYEVDDKNSAQQDIGECGEAIPASEVPEGAYRIGSRTSSRMCVFYDTALDAATRSDNKELCTLSVSGGAMTATFYMTAAYTHIFMGTGEQAASFADEAGTDDAAYVKGEPLVVNTPSGTVSVYRYTMAIPALNSPIAFASYNGGSAGVEDGKWFNRRVVFTPSDALLAAMAASDENVNEPDPGPAEREPTGEPVSAPAQTGREPAEAVAEAPSEVIEFEEGGRERDQAQAKRWKSEAGAAQRQLPAANPVDPGNRRSESEESASGEAAGVGQPNATGSGGKMRGVLLSPALAGAQDSGGKAAVVAVAEEPAGQALPAELALALGALAMALAGVLVRTAAFVAGKRGWRG